jgi:MlaD protein
MQLRGIQVGSVLNVQPHLDRVDVLLEIDDENTVIPRNARIFANQSGLIAEPLVDIMPQDPIPDYSASPLADACKCVPTPPLTEPCVCMWMTRTPHRRQREPGRPTRLLVPSSLVRVPAPFERACMRCPRSAWRPLAAWRAMRNPAPFLSHFFSNPAPLAFSFFFPPWQPGAQSSPPDSLVHAGARPPSCATKA